MPYINDTFYRLYDDSPKGFSYPIILLHGSSGSHLSWPGEMRRLDHKRVIALDLPGHGKTLSSVCHSIQTLVFSLQRFLQALKIQRVILIGHSLGSVLALHYAAAFPQNVLGMFLLACGASFSIPASLFDTLRSPLPMEKVVEEFSKIAFDENFPQELRRKVLAPMHTLRKSTLLSDLAICAGFSDSTNFSGITCPVRLVAGENDLITQPDAVRQLAFSLPNAGFSILPQCGHLLLYEKTDLVAGKLNGFLGNKAMPWQLVD